MSKVMIHSATYQNIRQAVDRAFELFPLKVKGKKIFIKPNVLRAGKAEEGITTHPAVLRAVVEKIEAMQPAAIVAGASRKQACWKPLGRIIKISEAIHRM